MQISCIDQSNGRMFFAYDFLTELNNFEHEVSLFLPKDVQKIYGSFFNNFSKIRLNCTNKFDSKEKFNLVFSDYDNLKNAKYLDDTLLYPLIVQTEIQNFKKLMKNKDPGLHKHIINIDKLESDKFIAKPVSKWALDMLQRQINDKLLEDISILISAGPTNEDIDPVRYLTNRSSGKMGIALARAAFRFGADVQLIHGPATEEPPSYLHVERVRSAADMFDAVMSHFGRNHVYIGSAAIADFTPSEVRQDKIKKKDGLSELILQPTKDILKEILVIKKNQLVIGFSVETNDYIKNSQTKLINKNLDLVVVNNPKEKGAAFDADTNIVSIIYKDGKIESWPIMSKMDVAIKLMLIIKKLLNG